MILRSGSVKGNIVVTPNPFVDQFQFSVNSTSNTDMVYTLSTIDGKQVKTASQRLIKGTNTLFVNDLKTLQTGIYLLTINTGDDIQTIKLIKSRP